MRCSTEGCRPCSAAGTMKIIFSRKGYDSAAGGIPSPIFDDETFCSLPIPSRQKPKLKEVRFRKTNLGFLVGQLKQDPDLAASGVHLDPDLNREARPRKPGWLPCFGQDGAAQTHLENQGIGNGDLFLFFGWFRRVLRENGELRYRQESQDIHCLFGWLQIGAVYHPGIDDRTPPQWTSGHPHVRYASAYCSEANNNTLYVASRRLSLPGFRRSVAGGGIFPHFTENLQLTAPGHERSLWRLPDFLYPTKGIPPLSFHGDLWRWQRDKGGVLLKTVGRGQEFVLDCAYYPKALNWIKEIFREAPTIQSRPRDAERS